MARHTNSPPGPCKGNKKMGWKAFAIFAAEQPGYFGSAPEHDPGRAEQVRQQLGLGGYDTVGLSTFDAGMYPRDGQLFIGAYPAGVIVCHDKLPGYFFDDQSRRSISGGSSDMQQSVSALLSLYPQGEVLAVVLHSVVNLWGYTLYSSGRLVRSAAGAADDGLIANVGMPLPEEARVLSTCPIDKVDEECAGEELVFDVAARMLGQRIDVFEPESLQISEYKTSAGPAQSFIGRLFGRK
jgi:hypothetical protein